MRQKLLLLAMVLIAPFIKVDACTNLIVAKGASTDGSVIVSYSADSFGLFGYLAHYPRAIHKNGEMRKIYEWDTGKYLGEIAEAAETYNVIGNINEHQVTIAETTWGGRKELHDPAGIMDYGSLIYVALQRSKTAREAIKVMTDLVKEYGYYSSGESFTIADPDEVWVMELIGKGENNKGAVWVAVRIPDDCIAAHANQSRIHKFDLKDKENVLYSPDVISFAREMGYFSGKNKDFSFSDAYNPLDFGGRRYCDARAWSFLNMFNKEFGDKYLPYVLGESDDAFPLYVKPEHKLSVADVMRGMRDHYEGTPLDFTQDIAAGPYHTPYRMSPLTYKAGDVDMFNERPISTQQPGFSFVSQMRSELPNEIGGVLWFGNDDANFVAYTPVYCCTDRVPECYRGDAQADCVTFSFDNAFWVCNWVAGMVRPWYDLKMPDVRKVQGRLENMFFAQQSGIEQTAMTLYKESPAKCAEFLTNYTCMQADVMIKEWNDLAKYLIVKWNDGVQKKVNADGTFVRPESGTCAPIVRPGYPEEYRKVILEATGDRWVVPAKK